MLILSPCVMHSILVIMIPDWLIHLFSKFNFAHIKNNIRTCTFSFVLFTIYIVSFVLRFCQYFNGSNGWLALARASGMVIYICFALSFLFVLRKMISHSRLLGLNQYLPLDHYLYFHKMNGIVFAACSALHSLGHLGNAYIISPIIDVPLIKLLFYPNQGIGYLGCACPTGWILAVLVLIMFICSLPFIRRTRRFEVIFPLAQNITYHFFVQLFFHTHWVCYVLIAVFMYVHAPLFIWFALPMIPFFIEKLIGKIAAARNCYGKTFVTEARLFDDVLQLVIRRPEFFDFKPGDFVYLRLENIARYEWHPITISSSPEDRNCKYILLRSIH